MSGDSSASSNSYNKKPLTQWTAPQKSPIKRDHYKSTRNLKRWMNKLKNSYMLTLFFGLSILPIQPSLAQGRWIISKNRDEMTNSLKIRTCVNSLNRISQKFPYDNGNTHARLCIHRNGEDFESSLQINQGQLLCGYENSNFLIKSDEKEAIEKICVGTTDHDPEMGYFEDGEEAVKEVASA